MHVGTRSSTQARSHAQKVLKQEVYDGLGMPTGREYLSAYTTPKKMSRSPGIVKKLKKPAEQIFRVEKDIDRLNERENLEQLRKRAFSESECMEMFHSRASLLVGAQAPALPQQVEPSQYVRLQEHYQMPYLLPWHYEQQQMVHEGYLQQPYYSNDQLDAMAQFEHRDDGVMLHPVDLMAEQQEEEPLFNPFAETEVQECDFYGVSSPDMSHANNPFFYL